MNCADIPGKPWGFNRESIAYSGAVARHGRIMRVIHRRDVSRCVANRTDTRIDARVLRATISAIFRGLVVWTS